MFLGLASGAWLILLITIASKKVKNKEVLKRWLRRQHLLMLASVFLILVISCAPGKMVGTGYLVSINTKKSKDFVWKRFDTTDSTDSFIFRKTQIQVSTPDLISNNPPFYDVRNGQYYIYVEKQAEYQRHGGKRHWKVYDEKLDCLTDKN
jgi:hypothetical protein